MWECALTDLAVTVLPCTPSHCQTTGTPDALTASMCPGSSPSILSWPYRVISTSFPSSLFGLRICTSSVSSSFFIDGPTLHPTGFEIPRKYLR